MTEIKAAAEIGARSILDDSVADVQVSSDIDNDGDEVVRVTVILRDEALNRINDLQFFNTLIAIKKKIRATGEPRPAMVNYATPSELADDADSES
ncbi:MAG: hypothetical protein PSY12_05590 [bacterium]|nr:hypothetical protein [bacterium]